ncbi:NAD-dependent epimerase/dehydratase family protein, partial [Allosphingosinicella sp.]|uniref:NAD-dependent epimerase/dehydratase family protein n=1 Tax=Allosphingosinicella sp. TaxID=2823234 RepID=UPI002EE8ADFA
REDDPVGGGGELGFYVTTKLCAERVLMDYARLLDVVILRPFFIYGAGQKRDMLMPRLADRIRLGEPVKLQGEEGLRTNPVHARDAAKAVAAALRLDGSHVINVAGPEILSLRSICETLGRAIGIEPRFETEPVPSPSSVADISRMKTLLGEPGIRLADRVGEIV